MLERCFQGDPRSAPVPPPPVPTPHHRLRALAGKRILLVEDHPINREILLGLLADTGLIIEVAVDGQQAVERFNDRPCDLILMDLQMPVMDGFTAAAHIRALDPKVPIIALTADAFAESAEKTRAAGMNAHLTKPINLERLSGVLLEYLAPSLAPSAEPPSDQTATSALVPPLAHPLATDTWTGHLPETPSYWGDLPHLDPSSALARLGDNTKLYEAILGNFVRSYTGLRLEQAAPDTPRTLHTLKGLSKTIGATRLSRLTELLEQTADQRLLTPLHQELETVIAAIDDWLAKRG